MVNFNIRDLSPVLLVAELERAMEFYHRLGFETEFIYEGFYAGLRKDGYSLHLKVAEHEKRRPAAGHVDVVLAVSGIRDLYETLKGAGVKIVQPLREMPYGLEFYIADPEGYVIAMIE